MRKLLVVTLAALLAGLTPTAVPARQAGPQDKGGKSADKVWKADDVKGLTSQDGKDVAVRGTVMKVYVPESQRAAILNFGKDSKTCFKAVIYPRSFDKWPGGLDGIKKYEGKEVTVEGKVSLFEKLPQVVVNVPGQIKDVR
jgi:hypothetical protein